MNNNKLSAILITIIFVLVGGALITVGILSLQMNNSQTVATNTPVTPTQAAVVTQSINSAVFTMETDGITKNTKSNIEVYVKNTGSNIINVSGVTITLKNTDSTLTIVPSTDFKPTNDWVWSPIRQGVISLIGSGKTHVAINPGEQKELGVFNVTAQSNFTLSFDKQYINIIGEKGLAIINRDATQASYSFTVN